MDARPHRRNLLAGRQLYVLVDGKDTEYALETLLQAILGAGVDVLQLRDERLTDRALFRRAQLAREMTRAAGTLLIINNRPDIAAIVRADGVHVGQNDLDVRDARSIVGVHALVGVSTHSVEQASKAVLDGADYIGVGPTFPSETKRFDRFPGLQLLKAVATQIAVPAFAIGGIHPDNARQVLATKITRLAVSAAITRAADPAHVIRQLRTVLDDAA